MNYKTLCIAIIGLALCLPSSAVMAVAPGKKRPDCGNTSSGFYPWLKKFRKEAEAKGISKKTLRSALGGVSYNPTVIRYDRNQKAFKKTFQQFWRLRVNNAMINRGRGIMRSRAALFSRIEKKYGVPASVIVAIWGMETNYGANSGNMRAFPSLATLTYDCRRSAFFKKELMAALRIVQRGDMRPGQMRGAWAGELGQTQFLASSYLKYAVDFDGNGRRDLVNSIPDVLASTANYLKGYGWRRGASWAPGTHNYRVLREWNKAGIYVRALSKMAALLDSNKVLPGGSGRRSYTSGGSGGSGGFDIH